MAAADTCGDVGGRAGLAAMIRRRGDLGAVYRWDLALVHHLGFGFHAVEMARRPELLAAHGLEVRVSTSFGDELLPEGLVTIVGRRAGG